MKVIVTGGCGFMGTNVVLKLLEKDEIETVVVIDKMTYASNNKLSEFAYVHPKLFIKKDDIVFLESTVFILTKRLEKSSKPGISQILDIKRETELTFPLVPLGIEISATLPEDCKFF